MNKHEAKLHSDMELLDNEITDIYNELGKAILGSDHEFIGQLCAGLLVRIGGRQQIYSVLNNENWPIT